MNIPKKIDVRNLLIDIVITLLALQLIDISGFVRETLAWMIYLIVPVQSFAFFLLYGDYGLDDGVGRKEAKNFPERFKSGLAVWLRGFAMFAWVLGFIWILVPVQYLEGATGRKYGGAAMISFFVALVSGIILLVRFFAKGEVGEKSIIEDFWRRSWSDRRWGEILIIPIYEFLLYGNLFSRAFSDWLGFVVTFAFLIYTETLFEVMVKSGHVSLPFLVVAILLSYLPMRLLLLIRPPFSTFEMLSAFAAFGVFIYTLLL